MRNNINNLKVSLGIALVASIGFSQLAMAVVCPLGQEDCRLPAMSTTEIEVLHKYGTQYICAMRTDPINPKIRIHGQVMGSGGFQLAPLRFIADDKGTRVDGEYKDVRIEGKFADADGKGKILITNDTVYDGLVGCSQVIVKPEKPQQ